MKRRKSLWLFVLSLLLFAALGFASCVDGKTSKNVTIEGFDDITVTAGYNTDFSLAQYITAVDSEGTGHKCSVSVKNADGESVDVVFNTFSVTTTEDYTAVCTVDFNGKTYERTITIKVVDASLPKITIGKMKTGSTGEAYVIPEITATKEIDGALTPEVKVYYVKSIGVEEQTIENGAFTPQKAGDYRLVATAEDAFGNVGTASADFVVRTGMSGEMLEDFSDALSASHVKSTTSTGVWHSAVTLGGETRKGVVKTEATNVNSDEKPTNGNNNFFRVTFNRTIEQLEQTGENFDYIAITLYVETAQEFENNQTRLFSWSTRTEPFYLNKWQTVKLPKAMIDGTNGVSYWSNDVAKEANAGLYDGVIDYFWNVHAEGGTDGTSMFQIKGLTSPATVYIDEIAVVRSTISSFTAPTSGEEFTVPTATLIGVNGATLATSNAPSVAYQVNATAAATDVTLENGKFSAETGVYTLTYDIVYGGRCYTKVVSFTVERGAMAANMLEDFDAGESIGNLWNPNTGSMTTEQKAQNEWFESYTDGSGVTKTGVAVVNGYGNDMRIRFNRTKAELETLGLDENDTISITILWTGVTWNITPTVFGVALTEKTPNTWNTYDISVGDIIAANTDLDTFLTNACSDGEGVQIKGNAGASSTLYVAEISFTKNA